jgi:tripartite-type tricarboxylate transporter receptor subunit TctC
LEQVVDHENASVHLGVAMVIIGLGLFTKTSPASSQTMADYFRGKTIRLIVPSDPGGDRGLYATVLAPFFSKHVPGNPAIIPSFMPGAGGSTAVNYAYGTAAPDGLTLVTPLPALVTAQAVGDSSVRYDALRFNWIGRVSDATHVLLMSTKIHAKTIPELDGHAAIVAAAGRTSETYLIPALMNQMLGTKFKIISGYQSAGKRNLAIENGEVDAAITTWNDVRVYHNDWIRKGGIMRLVAQIALQKHRDLPNLPLLLDYAQSLPDRQVLEFASFSSQLGQSYAAPPGVQPPIVDALRHAFDATMKDPDFVEKLKSSNMDFNPITGEEVTTFVTQAMSTPKEVVDRYKSATGSD